MISTDRRVGTDVGTHSGISAPAASRSNPRSVRHLITGISDNLDVLTQSTENLDFQTLVVSKFDFVNFTRPFMMRQSILTRPYLILRYSIGWTPGIDGAGNSLLYTPLSSRTY